MPDRPVASLADYNLDCVATALFIYPVKACAAVAVQTLTLDERGGALDDRRWAVVDDQGVLTWQGAHPRLALVHPRLTATGLALSASGFANIETPPALRACSVKIWNDASARHDAFEAADAGDALGAWLARVAGTGLRLVRLSEQAVVRDGPAALHLILAASVSAIDAHLRAAGHAPADLRRYRPNIVLSAIACEVVDAFVEESVRAFDWHGQTGTTRLEATAPCIRCVVPNVDPASARVDPETLNALAELAQRRQPGGPTTLGVYVRGVAGAHLHAGDGVRLVPAF